MENKVSTIELFRATNGAIVQNNTITSDEIDLRNINANGFFSLHTIHLGGTLGVTVLVCSTAGGTYVAPTTAVVIMTGKAAGTYFISFDPPLAPFMKLLFTEQNAAAITSLDAWLHIQ